MHGNIIFYIHSVTLKKKKWLKIDLLASWGNAVMFLAVSYFLLPAKSTIWLV